MLESEPNFCLISKYIYLYIYRYKTFRYIFVFSWLYFTFLPLYSLCPVILIVKNLFYLAILYADFSLML